MNTIDPSALAEGLLGGPASLHLEPRTTGRSGAQSYLVRAGERRYMLKIDALGRSAERWQTTVAIQRAAAERGVAPQVVASDASARAVLSICVPETPLLAALFDPARTEAVLGSLIDQVASLHRIDATPFAADVTPLTRCRTVLDRLPYALPSFARDPWVDLQRRDPSEQADALCHLDLNPSNLVFDGERVWLVDWDTAGPGNRWLDLATVVNMLRLSPERTAWMFERYGLRPSHEAFADARRLVYAAYGFAFLDLVPEPTALPLGEVSLAQCYQAMREGRLDMDTDAGRLQLAQAYFASYWEVA